MRDRPSRGRGSSTGTLVVLALVTVAGAALRIAMLASLPLIVTPDGSWAPDGKGYIPWGLALFESADFAGPPVRTPGYPLFLAGVFALLGTSGTAILLAQHLLGLVTVALITLVAARLAGPWIALVTGLLAAFDPWHLLFAHYALSESLMAFAVVAAAAAVLLPRERGAAQGLLVGLLSGAICLVRPTGQVLVPFLVLAFLSAGPRRLAELYLPLLAVALGLVLSLGPWLAFNLARGVRGLAAAEEPLLFTTSAYHGILDAHATPDGTPPEIRRVFNETIGAAASEPAAARFLEACRSTGLAWELRAAWARDSVRADPGRYLAAVGHTLRWLLNVGDPLHPPISDELLFFARRPVLDGTLQNNQAPNFQGGLLEPALARKFVMAPGRPGSLAARFLEPFGTPAGRGIPQVPLALLASVACVLAFLRRRWPEALALAGSLAFVLAHAFILYAWQRYSLPAEMLWFLSIPILAGVLRRERAP